MTRAVRIHEFGGTDVLKVEEVEVGEPGPGEVRLRHAAAAIHFADTLTREGLYFVKPELPAILGLEAAGTIKAVGPGVEGFAPGDRVGYRFNVGAYAEARIIPATVLYKVPDDIALETVAANFVRLLTAQYLVRRVYPVGSDDTVLIHAAAGGVGTILCQWCKHLGATVIGTVGSPAKVAVARDAGADHVIDYSREDFAARVLEITGGEGLPVLYDSVGKAVHEGNLAVLAPRGWYVNYGHASGFLPPLDAMELNRKSLVFTKTSMKDFIRAEGERKAMADEVFALLRAGVLTPAITGRYTLDEIARAHEDLAARRTTGSLVLTFPG